MSWNQGLDSDAAVALDDLFLVGIRADEGLFHKVNHLLGVVEFGYGGDFHVLERELTQDVHTLVAVLYVARVHLLGGDVVPRHHQWHLGDD